MTGLYAYKIKKAVDLEFLNFTSLENRRKYCYEELRLNRRTAPDLYLDVLAIGGSAIAPRFGVVPAIEYALKMREFAQADLASNALENGRLERHYWDRLAEDLERFHASAAIAGAQSEFGLPKQIRQWALQNFRQIDQHASTAHALRERQGLEEWTRAAYVELENAFETRRLGGHVRECHGDLHLGNMAVIEGRLVPFDCLEFNPSLRWSDVMSDLAFLTMDLRHRDARPVASRLLNKYLEISADYAGLEVLKFYQVYRAVVRGKVALIKFRQGGADSATPLREFERYMALAMSYLESPRPALIITHGLSGSGKTVLSEGLVQAIDAVRIRSDVERKRLHGLGALARTQAPVGGGLYDSSATDRTYERLLQLAQGVVRHGYSVIADAAFLKTAQRQVFRQAAKTLGVPFMILDFAVPVAVLRQRLMERSRMNADASDATVRVLDHQLRTREPLSEEEKSFTYTMDTQLPLEEAFRAGFWEGLLDRLAEIRIKIPSSESFP
ncbi:MAG: AAA family ATPase [Burkholderiales bacterium]